MTGRLVRAVAGAGDAGLPPHPDPHCRSPAASHHSRSRAAGDVGPGSQGRGASQGRGRSWTAGDVGPGRAVAGKITVSLGAHNIKQREQSQQKILVHRRIPHPKYNRETFNNDIMLLQLSHSAVLNNCVQLIPLPNANSRVRPGSMCSVAGWGLTGRNSRTDTLREVDLGVMRDNMCELYSGYNPSVMLCVGKPGMHKLPYRGDSGGPLVCEGVAQGIASYVDGNFYHPSVFTRLSTFIPWIQKILQKQQ